MANVVLIADDLTGAADSSAPFASHGLSTRLLLDIQQETPTTTQVTALSTRSRELEPEPAKAAVDYACRWVDQHDLGSQLLFKKIDSTLRGHIADELSVFVDHFNVERILVSPAFPSQGRTTLHGKHHVHGIPVSRTTFARNNFTDNLLERFRKITHLPTHHIPIEKLRGTERLAPKFEQPGMFIPDIQSDVDMLRVVHAALEAGMTHFCGAAGLGRALAATLGGEANHEPAFAQCKRPLLIVAGSRNQATVDQVEEARKTGVPVVSPNSGNANVVQEVEFHLSRGENVIMTSQTPRTEEFTPEAVRMALGKIVAGIIHTTRPGMIVLTGGDVAAAVCREIDVTGVTLYGEIEPGMPVGLLESSQVAGLPILTKAGGFGDRKAFVRTLELARHQK
jgi:D-threonate/D-erythronate kinase